MKKELESYAGEFGDVHLLDLVSVVHKDKKAHSGLLSGGPKSTISRTKSLFQSGVRTAREVSNLVKKGLAASTERNDAFPRLTDESLGLIVQMCGKEEYFSGQNIITQGEMDDRYFVLRRGCVDVYMDDRRLGSMEQGVGFGEIGLLLNTKRTATVKCATPCEVYALERADYETVLSLLPGFQRVGPLAAALNNFWLLMTGPDGSRRESVDYKAYLKAHLRTSKTLMANADAEEFDADEEREVAQSDWSEDCARYHLKVTESLSKSQYFSAMYQMVELWSEDAKLSYSTFLQWVFDNIAEFDEEQRVFLFKKVDAVEAVGDKFEKLKEDARAEAAAKKAAAAAAAAAAEALAAAEAAAAEEQAQIRAAIEAKKQAFAEKNQELAGERDELGRQLSALDDEEAELLRRLASGELTPEEEAEVRARLEAIAAERAALQAALTDNQYKTELLALEQKLSALDDEEAELLRRLAAGDLSPEEEAAIRKRLGEIAAEREVLMQQRAATLAGQGDAAFEAEDKKLAAMLDAIDRKLSALDDEEAELLRRLAAGDLTPEEEAAIRKRLAEIASEREGLLLERHAVLAARHAAQTAHKEQQLNAELAELKRRLSALDDEEAELLRRLAAGNLSPEEEAAIRARLAAIGLERASLQSKLTQTGFAAQLAEIQGKLSALDDEEAELRRRLAAGDLSPEEEAAIRQRLEEIDSERQQLLAQQLKIYEAEEAALRELMLSGNLSEEDMARLRARLDDLQEEAFDAKEQMAMLQMKAASQSPKNDSKLDHLKGLLEPAEPSLTDAEKHALWQAEMDERRFRRNEVLADRRGRIATPELAQGSAVNADARQRRSAQMAASAARENSWLEFDASRLPARQLAEWNHLRSTLRKTGAAGRGRALAWLDKIMREMDLHEPVVAPDMFTTQEMKRKKNKKNRRKRQQRGSGAASAPPMLSDDYQPPSMRVTEDAVTRAVARSEGRFPARHSPAGLLDPMPKRLSRSFEVRSEAEFDKAFDHRRAPAHGHNPKHGKVRVSLRSQAGARARSHDLAPLPWARSAVQVPPGGAFAPGRTTDFSRLKTPLSKML